MPQGGVDQGEDFVSYKRELVEETSIKNIKILKELDKIYQYELQKLLVLFGKENLGVKGKNGL